MANEDVGGGRWAVGENKCSRGKPFSLRWPTPSTVDDVQGGHLGDMASTSANASAKTTQQQERAANRRRESNRLWNKTVMEKT